MSYRFASASVVLVLGILTGCGGGPSTWVKVQPIDAYRGYEDFQPEHDKAVLARSKTLDVAGTQVRIFQEALPAGIELHEGVFGVARDHEHHLIGKLAYSPGKAVAKTELVARVKKLVIAAGGDAAIVVFLATDAKNFDVAQGVEAIVVKLDPRVSASVGSKAPAPSTMDDKRLPSGTNAKSL